MSDEALGRLVGRKVVNGKAGHCRIYNHRYDDEKELTLLGVIPASEIRDLSGGLMAQEVPVTLNRRVLDYDFVFVCGPHISS